MKRVVSTVAIVLVAVALAPAAAQAKFGVYDFDVALTNADGTPATQAGSHPFAMTTSFGVNFGGTIPGVPDGRLRNVIAQLPPGFVADATAYPRCSTADFATIGNGGPSCPLDTVVGIAGASITNAGNWTTAAIFNLPPPPGVLLRLGFNVLGTANVLIDARLSHDPPYRGVGFTLNAPETLDVFGGKTQLWGNPSDAKHDPFRGQCGLQTSTLPPGDIEGFQFENQSGETCPVEPRSKPFLTLPTNCSAPLSSELEVLSWEGDAAGASALTHDAGGNPTPFSGCGALGFSPSIEAKPTSKAAESPTGLDLSVDVADEGLTSVGGLADSDIRKVVLTLPEGMTANPSVAEGLEVCSEADLERETLDSAPGEGCPEASKLGTVEVESPLVDEPITGALYQATPYENLAGNSLIALYFVFENKNLGIIVKQPARVEPDPKTGQLVGITEEIPQLPFSSFRLRFREGGRSPLVSPPHCGEFQAKAEMTPWSGGAATTTTSTFKLISGPDGGPCPPGGTAPFDPGFEAGSANNAAGHYSPFSMRLTRRDGDQDLTRFDAKLPPGVVARLAGTSECSDAQIAAAKAKTGLDELHNPSCPSGSKIGAVEAGAGVGSQLTYVSGSIYLAGPFGGAPLSVVAIVPAVAGPFDVGTVVTREALQIDPRTAEVTADGAHSDPLPHILKGIPLVIRDIQVQVDKPDFTINPTACDPFATRAAIWGGGVNPFSIADDSPVARQDRYQAASCASLGFKPKLSIKLDGGTHRGGHPGLRAVLRARKGDANIEGTTVRLPRSAFLDQGHIRTVCTRVQFAAKACPPGAVYGHVRAFTPLLSEPLEGPIYLRSSSHKLPDLVFDLHGLVDVEASARIDSIHGGIRTTFTEVPDAPIEKVIATFQGAKKGLIVNSTDLCARKHSANVQLEAHNGKRLTLEPVVQPGCKKR